MGMSKLRDNLVERLRVAYQQVAGIEEAIELLDAETGTVKEQVLRKGITDRDAVIAKLKAGAL